MGVWVSVQDEGWCTTMIRPFRELRVYQRAQEQYALTDQIRRSSRSACANKAEAWRKRRYPGHFVSKLTDADAEAAETQNWLDMTFRCGYLSEDRYRELDAVYDDVTKGLVGRMKHRDARCGPAVLREDFKVCEASPDINPH